MKSCPQLSTLNSQLLNCQLLNCQLLNCQLLNESYHHTCSPFSYVKIRCSCPLVLSRSTYKPPLGTFLKVSTLLVATCVPKSDQFPSFHTCLF